MKRWQRNFLFRRLGDLRDFHDWLGGRIEAWDRALERDRAKRRPKPLCFPSDLQLRMSEMVDLLVKRLAKEESERLMHAQAFFVDGPLWRVKGDGAPFTPIVRIQTSEDYRDD